MFASSDIPDWIKACILGKDIDYEITEEENTLIYRASPISLVQNVKTPSLILVGGKDLRVPPHQSLQYHSMLKAKGVTSKLYFYPEDGHSIAGNETNIDAVMNMLQWFDEYLMPDTFST